MMDPTPLRPPSEVAGGFIAMPLGGQTYTVKVLPMVHSRKWLEQLQQMVATMRGTAGELATFEDVVGFLAGQSVAMMDSLLAYDALGAKALPERDWIDTNATDGEVYDFWKRVTAATAPLAQEGLRIFPTLVPELVDAFRKAVSQGTTTAMIAITSSKSMSSSLRNTESARRRRSKPDSPTSSSPSTRRKPRSAKQSKPSPPSTAS
jgi:hypothetical protein